MHTAIWFIWYMFNYIYISNFIHIYIFHICVYPSYWDCLCFPSLQTKYDKTLPNPSGEFGAVSAYLHEHSQHKSIMQIDQTLWANITSQIQIIEHHWTSLTGMFPYVPICSHIFPYFPHGVAVIPLILQPHPSWYHRSEPRKSGLALSSQRERRAITWSMQGWFWASRLHQKWITCENDVKMIKSQEKNMDLSWPIYLSIYLSI